MTEYRHTQEMGEISGFGGDYETTCQNMLNAGVQWLMENKDANLQGHSFSGIFGILIADSDEAKSMEAAMMSATGGDGCSGAMHHAVMARLFYIAKNGWEKYCAEVLAGEADEARK